MNLNDFILTKRKFQTESVELYIKTLEDEIVRLNKMVDNPSINDDIIEFEPIKRSSKFRDNELENECLIFWKKNGFDFDLDHIKIHEPKLFAREMKKAYDRMNQRQHYRANKLKNKAFELNDIEY